MDAVAWLMLSVFANLILLVIVAAAAAAASTSFREKLDLQRKLADQATETARLSGKLDNANADLSRSHTELLNLRAAINRSLDFLEVKNRELDED